MSTPFIAFCIGTLCVSIAVGLLNNSFASGLLCFGCAAVFYSIFVSIYKALDKCSF